MEILITRYSREDGVSISRSDINPDHWYLLDADAMAYDFEKSQFATEDNFLLEETPSSDTGSQYLTTFSNAMRVLETVESVTKGAT